MESSPTVPEVKADRVEALAADAVIERSLPTAGDASLARALERLPDAIAASDAEAQAEK